MITSPKLQQILQGRIDLFYTIIIKTLQKTKEHMKNFLVILLVTLFLSACQQGDRMQEEMDMGTVIDSLSCGDEIDWFGLPSSLSPIHFITRLDDLRKRHEASISIADKAYTMTVLVSNDVPYGKYLLTPMTPPVDYFLFVSVRSMLKTPPWGTTKYLTIEKVCE